MTRKAGFCYWIASVFLVFVSCAKKAEIRATWIHPIKMDGIHTFKMNAFSSQPAFSKEWSAPRLGEDRRFFRSLQKPGGCILFNALKKESYVLHIQSQPGPGKFAIRIQNKIIPVDKGDVELVLDSEVIHADENRLDFLVDNELRALSVRLFPRRITEFQTVKELVKDEDFFLLPGALKYYLKPLPGEALLLCFDLGRINKMNVRVAIKTSERTVESDARIESNHDFKIRLVPGEFQEIQILVRGENGGFLKIKKSLLLSRFIKKNSQKMKKAVRNKNVLLICLDAARSDHIRFNGYARETTPNIDQLARQSLVYQNTYSEAAYTLASSATLVTGLPPDSHNVLSAFFSSLRLDLTTIAELFHKKGYFTGAISANPYFGKAYRLDRGFDEFRELFEGKKQVLAEEFIAPFREILSHAQGKPFFVCLHIREPHQDYLMPPPFLGWFQNKYAGQTEEYIKKMHEILQSERNSKEDMLLLQDLYDENLLYADSAVGRLLQILEEKNIERRTLKIITADHGECLGEHGLVGHNVILYREGIHIPLIVNIPGIRPKVTDRPAVTSDIVVTLADLFELEFPYSTSSRGRDFFNLANERRRICRALSSAQGFPGYTVEHYPYKLIAYLPNAAESSELYNLQDDPREKTSLEGHGLIKDTLFYYLYDYLKASEKSPQESEKAELREKDLQQLKSLGYIQ